MKLKNAKYLNLRPLFRQQNDVYRKLFEMEPDRMSDCSRLARFLTGTSIGLVLGGGGARSVYFRGIMVLEKYDHDNGISSKY